MKPDRGVTMSMARCVQCPPLSAWPDRNLIFGQCPQCSGAGDPDKTWRQLVARQLIEARP
jgi:hypothetical protein